jgi:phage baseplate assembly protein W
MMSNEIQFLPLVGWPLLPLPDENGSMNYPSLEKSIAQSIQIILQTRPGEQLMDPQFGAGLENYLHAPNTLTTRRQIQEAILHALTRWEARIQLDRVEVMDDPVEASRVRVEIVYRLRRTGILQQLRLTLQLNSNL